ncbi:vacuolar acid trehalase [Scheffersomyces xylosifermentans]|uniref:vacuolar acid trehalase n=1 Tax=Scheffersomyces xylosifermentans TaxID=1304137 RepID=UPI00315D4343
MANESLEYIWSSFSSLYDTLVENVYRKQFVIKSMIFFNIGLLFLLHWYFSVVSHAFPLALRDSSFGAVTHESVAASRSQLLKLVNSPQNKAVYTQLKYAANAFFDTETNTVGTSRFTPYNQYQRQPYVANGYIGSRIPNLGQGFTYDQISDSADATEDDLSNGWPLFNKRYAGAFIAGFFDIQKNTSGTNFPELLANGYESVIAAVPQWTSLTVSTIKNGQTYSLDPANSVELADQIANYAQNLSLSNGIVTTEFTWLDDIQVRIEVLAHRTEINLGVVDLQISNLGNTSLNFTVVDSLDFASAQRSQLNGVGNDDSGIYITFSPNELPYINGAIYSTLKNNGDQSRTTTKSNSSQSVDVSIEAGKSVNLTKFVGIASTDLDPSTLTDSDKVLGLARDTSQKHNDFQEVVSSHLVGWAQTLESTPAITFADDRLLTLASRASLYHLTANTRPDAQGVSAALSVGGLSSDSYAGMVFWDADIWMMSGLLPFIPSHAKSIVNYRVHTHDQAIANLPEGASGAVYPWTSGRFGNCTATGPCLDYEYHINVAVALSAWELYLSGGADDTFLLENVYPLVTDAAKFFSDYVVKYNSTFGQYTTHNLTDPDEYANHVDNGAYTNAGISLVMKWAIQVADHLGRDFPSQFSDIVGNMHLPTSNNADNITLEYTGMNSSVGIKQADVIMMTYPLQNELITSEQALTNMAFYSMKQVNYGPAMTFPIFSIVASNLSPTGCSSQSYLQKAVQPFLRGPFAQFSEQNNDDYLTNGATHPAFPFLTAHGGFLQAVLQGLTGLRFDYVIENGRITRVLNFDPIALPCLPNGVIFEGIKYNNHSLSLSINDTSFTVANHGPIAGSHTSDDSIRIKIGDRNDQAGYYTLNEDEQLSFPLYTPEPSYPDSISECGLANFYNITDGAYGDSPISMNDGDNTTQWQAKFNDTTGKILIDFKQFKNLTGGFINWGDKPALNWKLSTFTGSLSEFKNVEDVLSQVDFGNDLYEIYRFEEEDYKLYKQDEVFHKVIDSNVSITAPFNLKDYTTIEIPRKQNITTFDLSDGLYARFVLIEIDGIHNTEPIEDDVGGAKLYEVVFK